MIPPNLNATLIERIDPDREHVILRVKPDDPGLLQFTPGQWTNLGIRFLEDFEVAARDYGLPDGILRRAYSIASKPISDPYLEFYLNLVPFGDLTPLLWPLKPGTRLWLDPRPHGDFTLSRVPQGRKILCVATGTGIAPFMSFVREFSGKARWKNLLIVQGARTLDSLGYREDLKTISQIDPSISFIPVLSRPGKESNWTGRTGWVQQLFLDETLFEQNGAALSPADWEVYLCGNSDMIHEIRELMLARGFRDAKLGKNGGIHIETYY